MKFTRKFTLNLAFPLLTLFLTSCGGGNSTNPPGQVQQEENDCLVLMNTVSINNGSTCTLTQSDADTYGITAGEISCDAGTLVYGGNQFDSGPNGVSFNGLTFMCVTSG